MNTYEQIAKIANDLDSLGLIKEANTVDEVLETLVNIKNVKVAGKNQSIISKKIDIFFKLCSINPINKEIDDKISIISSNIMKEAIFGTIGDGIKNLITSPFIGVYERGQYEKIQSEISKLTNKTNNMLDSGVNDNELSSLISECNQIRMYCVNAAGKARKFPKLFYIAQNLSMVLWSWVDEAKKLLGENKSESRLQNNDKAISILHRLLFQVWTNNANTQSSIPQQEAKPSETASKVFDKESL